MSDTEDSTCSSAETSSRTGKSPCLQKKCGARYYKTKFDMAWIQSGPFKGVIVPVKHDTSFFRCLICEKNVSCSHQGIFDVKRHVSGKAHRALEDRKSRNRTIAGSSAEQESTEEWLVRESEIRITEFLAENSIPFSAADQFVSLLRQCFPDSKIAQAFVCDSTRADNALINVIAPELLSNLVADMRSSFFSLCVDGSNHQESKKKLCPLTVRIFDFKQGRVCCKFFDLCISNIDTVESMLTAVCNAMDKYSMPWSKCIGFGVDNASVSMGKYNTIKSVVHSLSDHIYFMGCPCHVAHESASHAVSAFYTFIKGFDVEDLLVDLHFWFNYASKVTKLYDRFYQFMDSDYRRVLKFISVQWLGMVTCLDRLIAEFDALKAYFLSSPDIEGASKGRLSRLVQCFEDPMTEIYCLFLQSSLPAFVHFNLLLQRDDPVIHLLYDAMVDLTALLLSRAFEGHVVHSFIRNPDADLADLSSDNYQIPESSLYVGISVRGKLKRMLEKEVIDQQKQCDFFEAVRCFHQAAVKYAMEMLPIHDEILKHARVFNVFEKQRYGFESVLFMVERFNVYLNFTKRDLACLEQEFLTYQIINFEDLSRKAREEAAISVNCSSGEVATYRMDVIWFHLEREFIFSSTQRSKLFLLSKIARVLFTLPCSNTDEERVFAQAKKIKTKLHPSSSPDRALSSILIFQTNKPRNEPGHSIIKQAEKIGFSKAASSHSLAGPQQPNLDPRE